MWLMHLANCLWLPLAHGGAEGGGGWHLPPLHPLLVNFTAALIPISVLSDWLGRWLGRDSLQKTAWWTLLYAAVVTPLTAAAGWWWMRDMEGMNDWRMPVHKWLGISMAAVAVALAIWRGRLYRTDRRPGYAYLVVASLSVVALVVQGDLGGQMSFGSTGDEAPSADVRHGNSEHHDGSSGHMQHSAASTTQSQGAHEHADSHGSTVQWQDHIDLKN